mmetsp:Transcript_11290/g.28483  ORF Transcript_11290/g.28483 Transcript_11290/m.28483 type:complete len:207 (-) Transcript_11290:1643-2263(-)
MDTWSTNTDISRCAVTCLSLSGFAFTTWQSKMWLIAMMMGSCWCGKCAQGVGSNVTWCSVNDSMPGICAPRASRSDASSRRITPTPSLSFDDRAVPNTTGSEMVRNGDGREDVFSSSLFNTGRARTRKPRGAPLRASLFASCLATGTPLGARCGEAASTFSWLPWRASAVLTSFFRPPTGVRAAEDGVCSGRMSLDFTSLSVRAGV